VNLRYPENWAVRPNPIADELARRARNWLRERGILRTPAAEEAFVKLSVGEYANWPFPFAEEDRAETITRFLALWIFHDDVLEESGVADREAIRQAIAGLPGSGGEPFLPCWRELGQTCAAAMSAAWTERHAERFAEWVDSVCEENTRALEYRATGQYPRLSDHLLRRRANIGVIPSLDFLEYEIDWELPEEVLRDPKMAVVADAAADCVAICNDLFGFTKDRSNRWANFVGCAMAEFGDDMGEAFKWVAHMHNSQVQKIRQNEALLLKQYPEHPMLAAWFEALHCMVYGFAQWHMRAPRYRPVHESDGWTVQITITPECPDPF